MGLMLNNQPIKGEVLLGKQTIGKMYYNHELVYENMLASGTVLWEGRIIPGAKSIISLKRVNGDLSNVKGVKVYWEGYSSQTNVTNILKKDMNLGYELKDEDYFYRPEASLKWNKKSSSFVAMSLGSGYNPTITKITAL